mmetsp:Transcript_104942/g.165595  ORF Transcript_104942/g.165595 Transcript_104942/m.165595 type:complete len:162 (+) Transcript_104942:2-487(+)
MDEDGDLTDDAKANLVASRYSQFLPKVSDAHKRMVAKFVVVMLFVIPIIVLLAVSIYSGRSYMTRCLKTKNEILLFNHDVSDTLKDSAISKPGPDPCSSVDRIEPASLPIQACESSAGNCLDSSDVGLHGFSSQSVAGITPVMQPLVVGAQCSVENIHCHG